MKEFRSAFVEIGVSIIEKGGDSLPKTGKKPIVSAQKNLTPVQVHAKLVTDAKAILISKGISDVMASEASEAIINWAFCIPAGGIPVGAATTMSAGTIVSAEEPIDLEP